MSKIKLGSLFDGIGVFPLAAAHFGIEPSWASEIEKVPISITKRNFPNMQHLGDITKLHGEMIPQVDIITFGSPCQDLSTAGFRKGLQGEKSSLFYHAIRILKEMRNVTNGKFPTFAVWENVMGLPDNWTYSGAGGTIISDNARYKALGNSIVLPCAEYIMSGIAEIFNL